MKVAGENKPGRIMATATDLMVPVAGLPITIARTYDSLERGKVGDFGYGWKLALGTRLEVNSAKDVTLTLHGRRVTFQFTPQSQGFPFYFLLNVKYTPEAGVFGSLASDGCQVVYNPAPNNPTLYTYTDSYGRVYKIGADGTLKSIQDLNGNTLTVPPNGISSSVLSRPAFDSSRRSRGAPFRAPGYPLGRSLSSP
ncbi:MAG: DUF6531 domain-containing protein [Acidobacteriota bacterium]